MQRNIVAFIVVTYYNVICTSNMQDKKNKEKGKIEYDFSR